MKTVSIFLIVLVTLINWSNAANEAVKESLECAKEENFDLNEFLSLTKRDFENPGDNFKCYLKCVFVKLNLMKNGVFNGEAYGKESELDKTAFEVCNAEQKAEVKATDCEKAFKMFKCTFDYAKNNATEDKA